MSRVILLCPQLITSQNLGALLESGSRTGSMNELTLTRQGPGATEAACYVGAGAPPLVSSRCPAKPLEAIFEGSGSPVSLSFHQACLGGVTGPLQKASIQLSGDQPSRPGHC